MEEDVLGGEALGGVLAEEAPDEALGARRKTVRQGELTPPDFGEQARVLLAVERIPGMRGVGNAGLVFAFRERLRSRAMEAGRGEGYNITDG